MTRYKEPKTRSENANILHTWHPRPGKTWTYPNKWQMAHQVARYRDFSKDWNLYLVKAVSMPPRDAGSTEVPHLEGIYAVEAKNKGSAEHVVKRYLSQRYLGDWNMVVTGKEWPKVGSELAAIEHGRQYFDFTFTIESHLGKKKAAKFGDMGATGDYRIDAFLDGEHFTVMGKKGQAPAPAVAHSLKRRLGAPVQLWPAERTPAGEMFRAQWYDPKKEVYREAKVEIWNVSTRRR